MLPALEPLLSESQPVESNDGCLRSVADSRMGPNHPRRRGAGSCARGTFAVCRLLGAAPRLQAAPTVRIVRIHFDGMRAPLTAQAQQSTSSLHTLAHPTHACRQEDEAIMLLIELSLAVVYMCVLIFKTCQMSSSVCLMYGMGQTET
eukprot:3940953-Prymnesium_polylepis.2